MLSTGLPNPQQSFPLDGIVAPPQSPAAASIQAGINDLNAATDAPGPVMPQNPSMGVGGAGKVSPQQITSYFVGKGLSPSQAQGVAMALIGESGGDPNAYNPAGGNLGAYGLAQDRADRQKRLVQFYGPTPTANQQLDFAWHELNTSEKGALDAVKAASTPEEARQAFSEHFERPSMRSEWARFGPEQQQADQREIAAGQALSGNLSQALQTYAAEAAKAPPGSAERDRLIGEMRQNSAEMMHEWRQKVMNPPAATPMQAWQNMGNAGVILALIAGLFSRQHLTAGLNAAAGALNAINKDSREEFARQYKIWHDQIDLGSQMITMENQDIRSLLADQKMAFDEKQTKLANMAVQIGLVKDIGQVNVEIADKMSNRLTQRENAQMALDKYTAQIDVHWQQMIAGKTQPYLLNEGGKKQIVTFNPITKEWQDASGNQIAAPDTGNLSKVGTEYQARSAPAMFAQKFIEEHPEATSQELSKAMGNYYYYQAVERAFGGGIMGRNLDSLNTVADHVLLVKQYAEALKNNQIPAANKIANKIAVEKGDPEVTTFEAGRDIMADEVVRLLTSTGGTDKDREGMKERMAAWFSPPQFAGVFDAFVDLTGGRFRAIEQHYAHNDPKLRDDFEQNLLTPEAREVFSAFRSPLALPHGSASLPAGIPPGSKVIGTRNGKDVYQAPDGSKWQAP